MPQEVQDKISEIQRLQKSAASIQDNRQKLFSQLNENSMVKKELDLLEDDAKVFKLIGPVLVKQDQEEAKSNVNKRIEFIEAEL